MRLSSASNWPSSSSRSTTMSELRSPDATASASCTARSSGRVTALLISQPISAAATTAAAQTASISSRSAT